MLTPQMYLCPRCGAPVGSVANPNDPTAGSYLSVEQHTTLNTSGAHSTVPPEIAQGWNWAAAFLTLFWAIAHRVWWLVLFGIAQPILGVALQATGSTAVQNVGSLIQFATQIGMIVYIGINGNRIAWQYRVFEGVEHFRKVQRIWAWWTLGIYAISIVLIVLVVIAVILIAAVAASSAQ